MTDWMTTAEAAGLLGLSKASGGTLDTLRNAGIEEKKVKGHGKGGKCLWRRDEVEAIVAERERAAALIAAGLRSCAGCKGWKARTEFAPSAHRCQQCMKKIAKKAWAEGKKHRRTFANTNPVQSEGGDDWHVGEPAKPGDADKYECMVPGSWFSHKPQPPGGKRKAYCRKCKAKSCIHHHGLTPKEVRRYCRVPSQYPAHQTADYADA